MPAPDLSEPSAELKSHSSRLLALLRRECEAQGPMPFERFMELALYAPGLGYYSAGLSKFGREGDFVTAPELGSLFAECLAEAIAPLLRSLPYAAIMEVGAGTGALAADLWLALERLKALPERYWILERSADLRERQIERLNLRAPQALPRIAWLDAPPKDGFIGVIIGNEVLDALPCARFVIEQGLLWELGVQVDEHGIREQLLPPRPALTQAVAKLREQLTAPLPEGFRSELVPTLAPWLATVSNGLHEGAVIFADYGFPRSEYYLPQRHQGTLVGHYRHRLLADPYWWPGLVDLSASVDFTAVAEAAIELGLQVSGFSSQAQFLIAAGLAERLEDVGLRSERERVKRNDEARRLTHAAAMGERFKVICMSRGLNLEQLPAALKLPFELHRL